MKRIDILAELVNKTCLDELLQREQFGDIYETIFQILVTLKCIPGIVYTEIYDGELHKLVKVTNFNKLLDIPLHQGGNASDFTIKNGEMTIAFSVKYKNRFVSDHSGVAKIKAAFEKYNYENYKIGLVVKDRSLVNPERKSDQVERDNHEKVIQDNLLFDLDDIKKGLTYFYNRFEGFTVQQIIECFNESFFPRQQLVLKIHQNMELLKLIKYTNQLQLLHNKPRSGKSIILLKFAEHLLKNGSKRVLIITSVKATIDSFIKLLDCYTDFINIKYNTQEDFKIIDTSFCGIVFCTIQYLKVNDKKEYLNRLQFDYIFFDECHIGGITDLTKQLLF